MNDNGLSLFRCEIFVLQSRCVQTSGCHLTCRMRPLALLCALVTVSVTAARARLPPLSPEMVNFVNKANTTWTVSAP